MSAPDWLVARPIAHRGLHDRANGLIENSIGAALAATAAGFAIECDVQDTADGEAVVFHDESLGRLTGAPGLVRETPSREVTGLALTDSHERVPSLAEFLAAIGGRVPLVIEIKSRFDGSETLARRTLAVLAGYPGPVALKSFDPDIVALLRALAPDRPRGIVAQSSYGEPDYAALPPERRRDMSELLHLPRTAPDFLSWRAADLPCAAPFLCRYLARMPVMTWTVRDASTARGVRAHADQIVFEGFRPEI